MLRLLLVLASFVVQAGLYYYLWRRLVVNTSLRQPWRTRLTVLLIGFWMAVPLVFLLRKLNPELAYALGWVAFYAPALAGLTIALLVLVDLGRLTLWAARRVSAKKGPAATPAEPIDIQRRIFMRRVTGGGAALSAISLAGHGTYEALRTPRIAKRNIKLDRLPASMDGFSIVQISDLHIGNTIEESFVRGVVDAANRAAPDLIVMTGDIVDGRIDELRQHAAPLADLRAPHGVFFVTGNHEYYADLEPWLAHIESMGIKVLRNERVPIGDASASFDLAGVDDFRAARYPGHGPDLAGALAGRDPQRELVLLAHQPVQIFESMEHGVGLQLSGHTHGGQIWPWHYIAQISQRGLLAGHSWHGKSQLYISRGTGYWGPPVRVFAKSEISKLILRAKDAA